jgi:DNA transposition AAA+ family ATPase
MPGDLLIIDEAQHLEIKALDQIRYFSDVGGIGIAYLGNDEIYTRIYGRGRKASFIGPLKSRVGKQLSIPHPTDEDVIAILGAWNIDGKKETDYALKIGLSSIGLRGLTQVLKQSAVIAESLNRVIDSRVLLTAVTNLGFNN